MKKFTIPLIVLGVIVLIFLLANHQKPSPLIGKAAPPFQLNLLEGGQIDINDLKGKPVILYFFASW